MPKILKNTTLSPISMDIIGLPPLQGGASVAIQEYDYGILFSNKCIIYITPYINTGDIVVNDGINDLSPVNGLNFIKYPDTALNARFLSDPERTNGFVAKNVQEAIEEARGSSIFTVVGNIHQLVYGNKGYSNNKWLKLYGDSKKPSNEAPGVVVWKSKLIGISFTNDSDGVNTDVEIHVSSQGDGSSPTSVVYTWGIINSRVCRKTDFSPDVIIEKGDKVGVYLKGTGNNPTDPNVVMYFQILADNSEEFCETYTGDFSVTGLGTGNS